MIKFLKTTRIEIENNNFHSINNIYLRQFFLKARKQKNLVLFFTFPIQISADIFILKDLFFIPTTNTSDNISIGFLRPSV